MSASLLATIAARRAQLDALRPRNAAPLAVLERFFDVEQTYMSNAIGGNTLTLPETAEVIEHGVTVLTKPLKDRLAVADHYEAVQWIRELAARGVPVDEAVVRELHRRVVARSEPRIAGIYSQHRRRIAGSTAVFPNPQIVPELMSAFGADLARLGDTPAAAFSAHFRLTAIRPFEDGNGRTARLLMNLLLLRAGYVPVAVRPGDRARYLEAFERRSLADKLASFQSFMHERLDATLAEYVAALEESEPAE